MKTKRLVFSVGFAMFAMFFGAGNLVFPLSVGAHSGDHLALGVLGFALTGVLVPFAGLFAISLYKGDYLEFLAPIGEIPAVIVAFLLIVIMGLLVGAPRTSALSYGTFQPFLPHKDNLLYVFNAVFFGLIFLACLKQNKVVDLLGYVLSPIKLFVLIVVISLGFIVAPHFAYFHTGPVHVFKSAITSGYGTMDLLASFFFCAFVYKFIEFKTMNDPEADHVKLTLISSLIGAGLLMSIYLGFIVVANRHAASLQGIPTQSLIGAVAKVLIDQGAGIFIALVVTLACFSTALALAAVTTDFFRDRVFQGIVPHKVVLSVVILITYLVSNLGFAEIMRLALPVLSILYPALIVLTITNLLAKFTKLRLSKWGFYIALILAIILH